jgi:hypothetical protein
MEPPHPTIADVEQLQNVIASGRIPVQCEDLFAS